MVPQVWPWARAALVRASTRAAKSPLGVVGAGVGVGVGVVAAPCTVTGKSMKDEGLFASAVRTVALPAARAVIRPLWLTVATLLLLVVHTSCPAVGARPFTCTLTCTVWPTVRVMAAAVPWALSRSLPGVFRPLPAPAPVSAAVPGVVVWLQAASSSRKGRASRRRRGETVRGMATVERPFSS